jgi:hypothetical protein
MPLFSRFKNKGAQPATKGKNASEQVNGKPTGPAVPRWASNWNSKAVVPEDVEELIHYCTAEMKSRGTMLLFALYLSENSQSHSRSSGFAILTSPIPTPFRLQRSSKLHSQLLQS